MISLDRGSGLLLERVNHLHVHCGIENRLSNRGPVGFSSKNRFKISLLRKTDFNFGDGIRADVISRVHFFGVVWGLLGDFVLIFGNATCAKR